MRENNVAVPDDLREAAAEIAKKQGRTVDDVAADALKRYIAHERLDEVARYGQQRMREMGLDKLSEEEREAYIDRVIHESREEQRRR